MDIRLSGGLGEFEIFPRRRLVEFSDEASALTYLRRAVAGPADLARLRRLLDEAGGAPGLERMDDDELLRAVAGRLAAGELKLRLVRRHEPVPPRPSSSTMTPREVEQSTPRTPPPAAQAPPPAAAVSEDDPMLAGIDQPAQAAVLVAAAESGAPLCET